MNGAGTSKPLNRNNVGPAGVTARVRCAACSVIKSLGQYEVGSCICARCARKPKGWRRGDLPTIGEFK